MSTNATSSPALHLLAPLLPPQDLRRNGDNSDQLEDWTEDGTNGRRTRRGGGVGGDGGGEKGAASGTKAYSGQEMKKAYYEAFWRARCVGVCVLVTWATAARTIIDTIPGTWYRATAASGST